MNKSLDSKDYPLYDFSYTNLEKKKTIETEWGSEGCKGMTGIIRAMKLFKELHTKKGNFLYIIKQKC